MSEGPFPRTVKEAVPYVTWGAVIFTFVFVFVEKLVEGNYGQALFALIGGLVVIAMALHSQTWLEKTNPNWLYLGLLVLLLGIIASPFVQEKRWPFSVWFPAAVRGQGFTQEQVDEKVAAALEADRAKRPQSPAMVVHDAPTQEQIDAAAADEIKKTRTERDALKTRVNELTDIVNAQAAAARGEWLPFPSGPILTRRLIHKEAQELDEMLVDLSDVIRSAQNMPDITDLLPQPGRRFGQPFESTLEKRGLPDAIERLQKYQAALLEFSSNVNTKIHAKNDKYTNDLSRIVGTTNVEPLRAALVSYIARLDVLRTQAPLSSNVLQMALFEVASRTQGEIAKFESWSRGFILERYPAARKEIETY